MYVGGKQVSTRGLTAEDSGLVIEAITRQSYFDKIILPFLEKIDYDEANRAARWRSADSVVVDPTIRFGKPVVAEVGVSTRLLRNVYYANGEDADAVGRWIGVEARHVMAAVAFEDSLAA